MHESPHITEAESEVMKLLWQKEPMTASEIISELTQQMQWSDQTIKTFLNRLHKKKPFDLKNPAGITFTIRSFRMMNT